MNVLLLEPIVFVALLIMLNLTEVAKTFEVERHRYVLQQFIGISKKRCSLVKTLAKDSQLNLKIDVSRDEIALYHVVSAASVVVPLKCHSKGFQGY